MADRPDPAPAIRRRPRREASTLRAAILDAARHEFLSHGYAATTTRAIAERADVSESLLFRYFGPKAALFDLVAFGPLTELMDRLVRSQAATTDPDCHRAHTRALLLEVVRYLRANPGLVRALAEVRSEPGSPSPFHRLDDYFTRARATVAQRDPRFTVSATVNLDMRMGFGMILGSVLFADWLLPDRDAPSEVLVDAIVRIITNGITPGAL